MAPLQRRDGATRRATAWLRNFPTKLDVPGLRLHFESLGAADLAGRARAVGIFTKAGVELFHGRLSSRD